jgi:hypothetical protein
VERPDSEAWVFAKNNGGDSLRLAIAASNTGRFGQGRRGASNTMASRLLLPFQELVNSLANEPRNRNILTVSNLLQSLYLLWLEADGSEFLPHV